MFASGAEALVNPVNCVGVSGKGLALIFRKLFPGNQRVYEDACRDMLLRVGEPYPYRLQDGENPLWIINFPTKQNWRDPSRIEWIREGLMTMNRIVMRRGIRSVAVPALGCGEGGLEWEPVKKLMSEVLVDRNTTEYLVYEPHMA